MATHGMSRLAIPLMLAAMTVAPTQSVAEGGSSAESPSSPDKLVISNYSLVPLDRATETCMADAGEPNGEDLSALPGEGTSSAPAGGGVGSCDVLVAAALEPVEYFSDPEQDFLSRLSALTQSNADYFNAVVATPTLEELLPYDMVIAFTDDF